MSDPDAEDDAAHDAAAEAASDRATDADLSERISSPDKVLWPSAQITKLDLAEYYVAVADRLLPHLAGRATTLKHSPKGVDDDGFMRKDLPDHAPPSVGRWTTYAKSARRSLDYAVIENVDALIWCAGQNVTEFHPCLFRVDRPDRLDTVVIDLDPSPDSVDAATTALWIREICDQLGLACAVKTSGGRGMHVTVPVERRYDTPRLRTFAEAIASKAVRRHPDELTTEFTKTERGGRLFVDCTRVGIGATVISAWSPRARSEPTVSTPLEWDEVVDGLDVTRFTQSVAVDRPAVAEPDPQRIERALDALGL